MSEHLFTDCPSTFVAGPPDESIRQEPHETAPGVEERMTYRCLVGFNSANRPVVAPPSGDWGTVVSRECAYLFLGQLEVLRSYVKGSGATPDARFRTRALYRGLRTVLAKAFLIPPHENPAERFQVTYGPQSPTWFEASRRVLEFDVTEGIRAPAQKIVCHVFALNTSPVTERLWPGFTDLVLNHRHSARLYDEASDSFLQCRPSHRVASRWFWEVVIAPRTLLRDAESDDFAQYFATPRTAPRSPRLLMRTPSNVSLIADMDIESGRSQAGDPDVPRVLPAHAKIEIDPSVYPQSRNDWAFVVEQLDAAVERGEAIDDELIQDIAARRQQLASKTYSYRAGAGATLESSIRVVEAVVELYLLGSEASGQD